MGLEIVDGTGSGSLVEVSDENRLQVDAHMVRKFSAVSNVHADTYSWTAVSEDLAALGTALYLANNSATKLLYIESIYVWADVPTQIKIHCPTYATPAGGTAVVGVNLNRTSGHLADATAMANETSNTFAAAKTILTIHNEETATVGNGRDIPYDGSLILGYHDSVAVDIVADSATYECTIVGYFHD